MQRIGRVAACVLWALCASIAGAQGGALEYPSAVLDAYDADASCWTGLGEFGGQVPELVVPELWLVGPPPSDLSAVTIAENHWIELLFAGDIIASGGNTVDIELTEYGRAGEQAIVFLTDGVDREYAVALAKADGTGGQESSYIALSLQSIPESFTARAIRLAAVDHGGGLPGFDLGYIRARVSNECGTAARFPTPVDRAPGVTPGQNLRWAPACDTTTQHLYLSEVRSQVESGDPACRYLLGLVDANGFSLPAVRLNTTYYWRVDGVSDADAGEVAMGPVWSFTTADRVTLDVFDRYEATQDVLDVWRPRGHADVQLYGGGGFRSCFRSMYLDYFYDVASSSEVCRYFDRPQDWAQNGVSVLQLWLSGDPDNASDGDMYIALSDGEHLQRVSCQDNDSILTQIDWAPWRVALDRFDQIDMSHITSFAIGFRPAKTRFEPSGQGRIWIDDIELFQSLCSEGVSLTADVTGDCSVDYADLGQMARNWLEDRLHTRAVIEPNTPELWYEFEGNSNDSIGTSHGVARGRLSYTTGLHGAAARFAYSDDQIVLSNALPVFAEISDGLTIAFWLNAADSEHLNDTICCSNYTYGESSPSISIVLGCWRNPGQYRWDCGSPWSFENRVAGHHNNKSEWAGQWNHWAFTKDVVEGRMSIYLNGVLYDTRSGAQTPIENVTSLELGGGWYGYYDGLMDDFQIYDYALSEAEVAYLASDGTGQLRLAVTPDGDLNGSNGVDLRDFSILADQWLDTALWQGF